MASQPIAKAYSGSARRLVRSLYPALGEVELDEVLLNIVEIAQALKECARPELPSD